MSETKSEQVLQRIENAIQQLEKKKSTLYFFVSDCKNTPNSSTQYIYQLASTLQDLGYKVCMLYQLNNEYTEHELNKLKKKKQPIDEYRCFTGVGKWLGEKYSSLKHMNVANGEWAVSPSDFLFIPEVFASLMKETYSKKVPCKRFVILQNFRYITEFIPFGDQWGSYGINDVIVTNQALGDKVKSVFPYVRTNVINPYIANNIIKPVVAKKLIVNIAAQRSSDVEHIIKTFYWKYPLYQFITFRALRDLPQDKYAEMLGEGCITVWHDPETPFGYSALEAMRSGNIVIGKIPENIPEWMVENGDLKNNGIWYDNIDDVPQLLAKVIGTWMRDEIPSELTEKMEETNKLYTTDIWKKSVKDFIESAFSNRKNEFISIKNTVKNKEEKEKV